jgi:RimJ/RimL family protein N-acetyltransferase
MTFEATIIGTRRLLLTPLRLDDADAMVRVLDDARLHEFIGGQPAGLAELRTRYERLAAGSGQDHERWLNWIARRRTDDRPVGTVQATVVRHADGWTAEVAWVVGVAWQGQGYASEAAAALVRWLRAEGATTVSANIHPDHAASAQVAERAGLVPTTEEVDGEQVWRTPADA